VAAYAVKLEQFEGPLDLLLALIKQGEIDIYDIPIALITEQYLAALELMAVLDLDVSGDFLIMAATLIQIKLRMLLPRPPAGEEEPEPQDPRWQLVEQLLEYERYKEAARHLAGRESETRCLFSRPVALLPDDGNGDHEPPSVGLFDLLLAFKDLLERQGKIQGYEISGEDVTLEDRLDFVQRTLRECSRVKFAELFPRQVRRVVIIVTFLAILELLRRGRIRLDQDGLFGEIWIEYDHEHSRARE